MGIFTRDTVAGQIARGFVVEGTGERQQAIALVMRRAERDAGAAIPAEFVLRQKRAGIEVQWRNATIGHVPASAAAEIGNQIAAAGRKLLTVRGRVVPKVGAWGAMVGADVDHGPNPLAGLGDLGGLLDLDKPVHIAGYQYRLQRFLGSAEAAGLEEPGQHYRVGHLVPEPENPHDPKAIRVLIGEQLVGYVPREATGRVGRAIRETGVGTARALVRVVVGQAQWSLHLVPVPK